MYLCTVSSLFSVILPINELNNVLLYVYFLTHIRSWTKARFPRDDAKCSGDLASLGLTEELTSSGLQWAKANATVLMSDLKYSLQCKIIFMQIL